MLCSGGAVVARLLPSLQQWIWKCVWSYNLSRADYSGSVQALLVPVPIVVMHCIELTSISRSAEYDRHHSGPDDFIFKIFMKELLRSVLPSRADCSKVFYLDFESDPINLQFVPSLRPALVGAAHCLQVQICMMRRSRHSAKQ